MKKTIAIVLCLLCLVSLASCGKSGEEVPDGFQIANRQGDTFRLYLPSTWNSTVSEGITGGYYTLTTTSNVRVDKIATDASAEDWFASTILPALSLVAEDVREKEAPADALLGTLNAKRYCHTGKIRTSSVVFLHLLGSTSEGLYVFTFTCDETLYENLLPDVEKMWEVFKLAESYEEATDGRTLPRDVETPTGMKIASGDDVAYRFFVPKDWRIDTSLSIVEAVAPADSSNVSLVPYLPEADSMSVEEFYTLHRGQLISVYGDALEEIGKSGDETLGGRPAVSVEYRIRDGEKTVCVKEYFAAYKSMIYTLCYTAEESNYAVHMEEVLRMLEEFSFR